MNPSHEPDNPCRGDLLLEDLDALRRRLDAERYTGPAWTAAPQRRHHHRLRWLVPTAAAVAAAALVLLHVATRPDKTAQTDSPLAVATQPTQPDQADSPVRMTWQFPATPTLPQTDGQNQSASGIRLPMPGSILPPKSEETVTLQFILPRIQVPTRTERSTEHDETNDSRTAVEPVGSRLAGLVHPRPAV
jgi:hypothetical protein